MSITRKKAGPLRGRLFWVNLLVRIQCRTRSVRTLVRRDYRHRTLQREIQHRFRRQLDLLTLRGCLNTAAQPAAGCCTDSSSLTAASDRADDGSDTGSGAYFLSRILATRRALTSVLIGLHVVVLIPNLNPVELQRQHGLAREFAGALHIHDVSFNIIARRDSNIALYCQR